MLDWHSLSCRSGQGAVQLCFPLMFTFGEMSQVPPVPEDHGVMPPPLRNASLPHVATVYNQCTGGGGVLVCLHPSTTAYLAPDLFMFCLLAVVLSTSPVALS
jgi:hypothetical protein